MSYLTGEESAANATVKALLRRAGFDTNGLRVRSRDAHVTVLGWADPTATTVSGVANAARLTLVEVLETLSDGTAYCGGGTNDVTVYWGGSAE